MGLNFNPDSSSMWISGGLQTAPSSYSNAAGPRGNLFNDGITNVGGNKSTTTSYTQNISQPALSPPGVNATNAILELNIKNTSSAPEGDSNPLTQGVDPSSYNSTYQNSFASNLEQIVQQNGLTQDQTSQLVFAQMSGEPISNNPQLNALLGQIKQNVLSDMAQSYPANSFPSLGDMANQLSGDSPLGTSSSQLADLQEYVDSLPEGAEKQQLQQFVQSAQSSLSGIAETLSQLSATTDQGQATTLLNQLQKEVGQLQQQFSSAGTLTQDPNLGSALGLVSKNIGDNLSAFSSEVGNATQINQLAQGNWNSVNGSTSENFMSFLQGTFETQFQGALTQFATTNNLTSAQVAQLEYAHNNPDSVTDPTIQKELQQINSTAVSKLSPAWGMPAGFTPSVNNSPFNEQVLASYNTAFKEQLAGTDVSNLASQLGLSQDAVKGLLTCLHYTSSSDNGASLNNPEGLSLLGLSSGSHLTTLVAVLNQIQGAAAQQISASTGLPAGVIPNSDSGAYTNMLNGRMMQQFDSNLNNQTPPLTQQQIQDVKAALTNPLDPNITTETKTLIQNIYTQSVTQVQVQYSTPPGVTPDVTKLVGITDQSPVVKIGNTGIDIVQTAMSSMMKFIDTTDPQNSSLINLLKIVSTALSNLQETIAQMEADSSQVQAAAQKAQSQANLDKLNDQNKKLEAEEKKAQKLKPLMEFLKVFKFLFAIIMDICSAGTLAPAMSPLFVTAAVQDLTTGTNFMTKAFASIMKNLPSPANIILGCILCLGISAEAGGILGLSVFFQNSGVIAQIVQECGGSKSQGQMANMITQVAVQIIAMLVTFLFGGEAAAPEEISEIISEVTELTQEVGNSLAESLPQDLQATIKEIPDQLANALNEVSKASEIEGEIANQMQVIEECGAESEKGIEAAKQIDKLEAMAESLKKEADPETAEMIQRIVSAVKNVNTLLSFANSMIQASVSFINAQFDKIEAALDAEIQELENLVKVYAQIIENMINGIASLSSWMSSVGQQENHLWSGLSQDVTAITNARM